MLIFSHFCELACSENRSRRFFLLKVPLTCKIFILLNEAVPLVKTDGDTKSRYTYVQIGKNPQLPVAVPFKVSHFCDDVTRGTVRRVQRIVNANFSCARDLFGFETLAYRR